jgi:enolase
MKISAIRACEIYDSRGMPTIACDIILEDHTYVTAMVPSGASTGTHEALELRDGGERLAGRGVQKAIENIRTRIAPVFVGRELDAIAMDQELIALDPSTQKTELGANAMLAVSMGFFKAHASLLGVELFSFIAHSLELKELSMPVPLINVINGARHAQNNLSVQEYLIVPYGAVSFADSIEMAVEITHTLKAVLKKMGKSTYTGDEGGFAPTFDHAHEPLDVIMTAIAQAGYEKNVSLGMDVAASEFYDATQKLYTFDGKQLHAEQLIAIFCDLAARYPILYLEDALAQDDWASWTMLNKALGDRVRIAGDDLLVTQHDRIVHALECDAINSVILKPNQVGTVSETIAAALLCQEAGLTTIASHRSGETCDTFIADLALGTNAHYLKCGGCMHGERVAKYNRLIQVESLIASF